MVAAVSCKDTAPLPASSVNSPANRLVPVFAAPASPLESADPKLLTSAHSKRLTENLSPAESAVTKTRGILPPPFVTPLEHSPTPASSISRRINGLRTLCTHRLIKNCRISRSFIRLRTLAKTMGGGTTYSTPKRRLEALPGQANVTKWGALKCGPVQKERTERTHRKNVQKEKAVSSRRTPKNEGPSRKMAPTESNGADLKIGHYKREKRRGHDISCPYTRMENTGTGRLPVLLGGFLGGADFLPAAGAFAELQDLFAEADGFGRDFDEFVVGDEFHGLFEAEFAMGNEANGFVGRGGAHVGELLFARDVDFHILFAGIFADDHAFVDAHGRADEKFAAFLQAPEGVSGADASAVGDERTRWAESHVSAVIDPAFENGVNERGAARVGKKLAAKADETARRNFKFEANAAGAVIAHLGHFAAAGAERFHDDANETVGNVDDDALLRLELAAVFVTHY